MPAPKFDNAPFAVLDWVIVTVSVCPTLGSAIETPANGSIGVTPDVGWSAAVPVTTGGACARSMVESDVAEFATPSLIVQAMVRVGSAVASVGSTAVLLKLTLRSTA